jgi:hypothetical protein
VINGLSSPKGEAKVDLLCSWGFAATCNSGGAWMIGPKVISRQWFSKRSRSKASSAAFSTGKRKTSMAEPSTSIIRRGRSGLDIGPPASPVKRSVESI